MTLNSYLEERLDKPEIIGPVEDKPGEILVVDDEKHIRRTLKHMLEKLGYLVWSAGNGIQALEILQRENIDLVISDINMPEMSGLDLVSQVQRIYAPPEILLITGEPSLESATSAIKLGVFDYVSKPLDADALLHTVHRAIEKKRLLEQKAYLEQENLRYQQELEKTLDQRTYYLSQTEEKYRGLFANANIGLGIMLEDLKLIEANPSLAKITGYSVPTLEKMGLPELFVNDNAVLQLNDLLKKMEKVDQFEAELKRYSGSVYWASLTLKKINYGGQPALLVTMRDISDQKKYEDSLKRAVADKEEMLREIHHRSKNNMNVIISLLNLQAYSIDDALVKDVLDMVSKRIYAMSLVHEQIYVSKELSHIELSTYLRSLVARYHSASDKPEGTIQVRQNYADVSIGLSQAIPLGLAMNELIANGFKHPFRGRESGTLSFDLSLTEDNQVKITVLDDGPGFPRDVDLDQPHSLGLHMAKILVEDQLLGQLQISNRGGACIRLTFPLELDPKG